MKDILSILILMFDKLKNKEKSRFNLNYELIINFIMVVLIIADTFLLLLSDFSDLSQTIVVNINYFDLFVCFALFCEFMFRFNKAEYKKDFLKDKNNIITIIAMIPVNFFVFRLLRYIKIVPLIYKGFIHFNKFLKETHLNWSLGVLVISISAGTFLFYFFEHGVNHHIQNLWDSFMYVMPTVSALGANYTPQTIGGDIVSLILMITGILSFGLFTASIASIYIKSDSKDQVSDEEFNELKSSMTNIEKEIKELKELLKK